MNISRRRLGALALGAATAVAARPAWAADQAEPAAVIQGLYDSLLEAMKQGKALGFDGRYKKLEPEINKAFDVATMCKIAVGPFWTSLATDKKNAVLVAFDRFMIATYASRFKDFTNQQFSVGASKPAPNDRVLVESKIVKSDGEPVALNYLLRKNPDGWQIIDVYLAGSISQMTQMRSEFSEPLQKNGVDGLIQQLDAKVKQMQSAA